MLSREILGVGASVSLHNHSDWSDGGSTLSEMCRGAKAAGLRVFGMSDHWVPAPKDGMDAVSWSMQLDKLDAYVTELKALRAELEDENFKLLIGVETDYFDENYIEMFAKLESAGLDYIIGSVHYSDVFPIDHDASDWEKLTQNEIDNIYEIYWNKMIGAAKFGKYDIIGHLDLPKKFGFKPSRDMMDLALKVLDAVQATGKAIELNTAGLDKQCREQYPTAQLLSEARKRGIPIVISSDAHAVSQLTRHFAEAEALLKQI